MGNYAETFFLHSQEKKTVKERKTVKFSKHIEEMPMSKFGNAEKNADSDHIKIAEVAVSKGQRNFTVLCIPA